MKNSSKTFRTFEAFDRTITLCLLKERIKAGYTKLSVGYSVRMPESEYKEDLDRDISLGRARKTPMASYRMALEITQTKSLTGRILDECSKVILENPNNWIKGIRVPETKENQ